MFGLFTLFKLIADLLPGVRVRVRTGDPHAVTHQRTALQVPGLRPWLHNQGMLTLILLACIKAEKPWHVGKFRPSKKQLLDRSLCSALDFFIGLHNEQSSVKNRSKKTSGEYLNMYLFSYIIKKLPALFSNIIMVSKPQMKVWKVEFMRCAVHITCFG
jgi:hypothetical protein